MPLKTKRDKYDATFSRLIRLRDGMCMHCGKVLPVERLECSHIISRSSAALRHDPRNAKALCFTCHRWWHENPLDAAEWVKGILGADHYDHLRVAGSRPTKVPKFEKDMIRSQQLELIKRLEAGEIIPVFNPQFQQIRRQLNV